MNALRSCPSMDVLRAERQGIARCTSLSLSPVFTSARRESAAWLYVSMLRCIRSSRCRSHQPTMTLRGYGRWHPGTPTLGRAVLCLRACALVVARHAHGHAHVVRVACACACGHVGMVCVEGPVCRGERAACVARLVVATPEGLGSPPCLPSPHHLPRVQALGSP